jgi:glutathione S-transferase
MLKLFYAPGACSLASHIALEETGAPYEAVRLDFAKGEQTQPAYRAVNPKGRVPALVTDRGVLTESPAILGYIAQAFPGAGLAPTDDLFAFSDVQAFNSFLSSTVHIIFAHVFRPGRYADGEDAAAAMRAKAPQALAEAFALIEEKLADGRPWVHGERYTVSDAYLYVFSRWLVSRPGLGDHSGLTRVAGHRARVQVRPAVQRVLAAEGLEPV